MLTGVEIGRRGISISEPDKNKYEDINIKSQLGTPWASFVDLLMHFV